MFFYCLCVYGVYNNVELLLCYYVVIYGAFRCPTSYTGVGCNIYAPVFSMLLCH